MPDTAVRPKQQTPAQTDRAGVRLGLFIGGLVVALIAGFSLGKVLGDPVSPTQGAKTGAPAGMDPMPGMSPGGDGDGHAHGGGAPAASAGSDVGGLSISSLGYTLVPAARSFGTGSHDLSFVIKGPDGLPATSFATVHEKQLHLIVARRDLTGFQHLHPTMSADGTWTVKATFDKAGPWRAFADFTALNASGAKVPLTLGADLTVAGDYQPARLPEPAREATVDGYSVQYAGTPATGATQPLLLRVFADGKPVTTLEPYLGSFGHLVVLREGDLGYVHVHPEERLAGDAVKFWLAAPSPGNYRMFFDFQIAGKVHTAEFTMVVQ